MKKANKISTISAIASIAGAMSASAAEISTNTAVMQAMDKITGQVSLIEVPVNQETTFGTFSIVVRECKTRTPEETPENFAFVDVVDKNTKKGDVNIFKGWMLSSTPALNPIAHPVYDVWLLKCVNKLVDPKNLMNKEQLDERDNIVMERSNQNDSDEKEPETQDEKPAFEGAVDGEPVNLIPNEIPNTDNAVNGENKDNIENDNVTQPSVSEQNETLPQQPVSETTSAPTADEKTLPATDDVVNNEGEPQALVVLPEKPAVADTSFQAGNASLQQADYETIDDDKAAENSANVKEVPEERPDIKAEEKATLDTVEPAEKVIEEKTPEITENKDNPKNSVSEQDVNSSKTDGSDDKKQVAASPETTENKNAPVSENTKENNNAVENSEDAISRLERELSEQLDGE